MFYIFLVISLFFIAVFQVSFLASFQFLEIVPNLILIILIYFALYREIIEVSILAFILGVFIDIISPGFFGMHILFFLAMIFLINLFKKTSVFHLSLFFVLISVLVFVLLYNLTFLGIFLYNSSLSGLKEWIEVIKIFSLNILGNLLTASFLFFVFRRIFEWFKIREGRMRIIN